MKDQKKLFNNLISVIIPVFNVESYLEEALNSVINQTYVNLEIIVINDCSSDRCGEICERYAKIDDRIIVLHNESNKGLATTRNIGLSIVRGSYVFFLDSDDWIELNAIEVLVESAVKNNADIVVARKYDEYVGKTIIPTKLKKKDMVPFLYTNTDILLEYLDGKFEDAIWNKLYRTQLFDGIVFPDGRNYEDVSTTWKLMKRVVEKGGIIVLLPDILFHFRMRNSSISHTKSLSNTVDAWTAYREKYEGLPSLSRLLLADCYSQIGSMWMSYAGFSSDEKTKATKIMKEMLGFSRQNYPVVMKECVNGRSYSLKTKALCLISQTTNSFVIKICYVVGIVIHRYRYSKNEKMFK